MPVAGYRNSTITIEAHEALGRMARRLQVDLGQHVNRSEAILLAERLLLGLDNDQIQQAARRVGLLAD